MTEEKDILKKPIQSDFNQTTPSVDFTDLVMQKIEKSLQTKPVFQPLISKKWWVITAVFGLLIIAFSLAIEIKETSIKWLDKIDIKPIEFSDFKTTFNLFIIIISVFAFMILVDLVYRRKNQLTT